MKKCIFILPAIFYLLAAQAQAGDANLDVIGSSFTNGYAQVRYTNAATLGNKPADLVQDADVNGSPYFDTRWSRAIILLQSGQAVKVEKLKVDLYRNEAHYLDVFGTELIAESGMVKKIYLLDRKDSLKVTAVFEKIVSLSGNNAAAFAQVLNNGKVSLLKFSPISILNKGYDPAVGKNSYSFVAKLSYAINKEGVILNLKELGEKAVLDAVMASPKHTDWLASNKNRLKNEKEIVSFFNYYNGLN